ncbi:MAG: hypothetical protein K9K79_09810 [Desulfohalobiaceae bacterium]|nr:hypothetical protein [Desulfohalobiaceae bacterium]
MVNFRGVNSLDETVEVIVRATKKKTSKMKEKRVPPKELRRTIIHDDLIAPAVSEDDWDVLQ